LKALLEFDTAGSRSCHDVEAKLQDDIDKSVGALNRMSPLVYLDFLAEELSDVVSF
jgi:hypothetical protein